MEKNGKTQQQGSTIKQNRYRKNGDREKKEI